MSNMIKLDRFEIQDAIYNNQNIIARKFIKIIYVCLDLKARGSLL